ncbi:putative ATP-dependent DNA helicase [Phytophthora infestans]|uniref:Putative ATP-dependent DNA helicase n=1 Tax=Phytophthora infestans TaxID=4787 RepID=A0A833W3G7_PHYIN|nr:putative ATP-dependent DNA helicase [Phytophthora infestans]
MQKKSHHVHRLHVHENGGQLVVYPTNSRIEDVLALSEFTMLTAFFALSDSASAEGDTTRRLLYHVIPVHFVWEKIGQRY